MPRPKPDNTDRDRAITAKATLGMTFEAIAAEYGITRQRVSQIVKAATPRAPGEAERAEVAATMRVKYDELQAVINHPPLKVSAMAKPTEDPRTGGYVVDESVKIRAIAEQNKIMDRYRAMFGVDITQPPAPFIDASTQIMVNQINLGRAADGLPPLRQLGSPSAATMSIGQAEAARKASPLYATGAGVVIPHAVAAEGAAAIHAYITNQQYRAQHAADTAAEVIEGEIIN